MSNLEDIKNRLAAATPGPWELLGGNEYISPIGITVAPDDGGVTSRDAEFIAHAPEDIAWLLGEVERQRSRAKFFEDAAARITRELNAHADAHEQCSESDS